MVSWRMACASVMPIITVTRVMCIAIGKRPATSTACATRGVRIEAMMDREGKCDCVYGYGGDSCDMPCTREDSCSSHGECVSGGYCVCDAGYEGEMCEKKESGYGVVIAILLVANCVVTYLWYRARVSNRGFLVRVSFPLIHSLSHLTSHLTHSPLTHSPLIHSLSHLTSHLTHSPLTHSHLTHSPLTHSPLTHSPLTHSHLTHSHISFTEYLLTSPRTPPSSSASCLLHFPLSPLVLLSSTQTTSPHVASAKPSSPSHTPPPPPRRCLQ